MEAYKERLADRLNAELVRRGEQPRDLAYALSIEPRTVERWVAAETFPQRRHLKAAADHLGLSVDDLRPDLEAEEQAVRDQLDRIEAKLDSFGHQLTGLLRAFATPPADGESAESRFDAVLTDLERELDEAGAADRPTRRAEPQ